MKTIYYKQCKLQKGNAYTTTYLPEQFARVGKYIDLKNDSIWSEGWEVIKVGVTRVPEDIANRNSQDYKHQRKASDI